MFSAAESFKIKYQLKLAEQLGDQFAGFFLLLPLCLPFLSSYHHLSYIYIYCIYSLSQRSFRLSH